MSMYLNSRILLKTDKWQIVNVLFLMEILWMPWSAFCIQIRENVYHVCQFIEANTMFLSNCSVQKSDYFSAKNCIVAESPQ